MRLLLSLLDHADLCEYELRAVGARPMPSGRWSKGRSTSSCSTSRSRTAHDGLVSVERVLAQAPKTPIVVLTGRDDYQLGLRAIAAGAQDFLVKGELKGNTILRCAQWSIARAAAGPANLGGERWKVLDRTVAAIAVVDRELKVVTANPAFVAMTGRDEDRCAAFLFEEELIETDDIVSFVLDLRATLRNEAPTRLVDVGLRTATGQEPVRLNFARIAPAEDEAPALLLVVTPVVVNPAE